MFFSKKHYFDKLVKRHVRSTEKHFKKFTTMRPTKTNIFALILTAGVIIVTCALYFSSPLLFRYKTSVFSKQNKEFKNKIWAHRVNSIGKAQEASQIFQGIEMDVVFNNRSHLFDVNHPPEDSIHLSLEQLFASLADPSVLSYWLDFKNLTKNNVTTSLDRLVQLCESFAINTDSIIVDSEHYQLLSDFTTRGFRTSYYLPTPFIAALEKKSYANLTISEQESLARMQNSITQGSFDYISTYSKYHSFIVTLLKTNKKILLWNTSLEHHKFFDRKKIKQIIARDKNIHVLLIQLESQYDR